MELYGVATLPAYHRHSLSCVTCILVEEHELEEILKTGLSFSLGNQRHMAKISDAESCLQKATKI